MGISQCTLLKQKCIQIYIYRVIDFTHVHAWNFFLKKMIYRSTSFDGNFDIKALHS